MDIPKQELEILDDYIKSEFRVSCHEKMRKLYIQRFMQVASKNNVDLDMVHFTINQGADGRTNIINIGVERDPAYLGENCDESLINDISDLLDKNKIAASLWDGEWEDEFELQVMLRKLSQDDLFKLCAIILTDKKEKKKYINAPIVRNSGW